MKFQKGQRVRWNESWGVWRDATILETKLEYAKEVYKIKDDRGSVCWIEEGFLAKKPERKEKLYKSATREDVAKDIIDSAMVSGKHLTNAVVAKWARQDGIRNQEDIEWIVEKVRKIINWDN